MLVGTCQDAQTGRCSVMPMPIDTYTTLERVPVFAGLATDQRRLLARSMGTHSFARGEMIFQEGSIGSALYVVAQGQVRIYTASDHGQELSVSIMRDGDFFGEMALLDGLPRSASAQAMCRTVCLTLHRDAFLHNLSVCPPIAVAVLEAMALRLRRTTHHAEHLASKSATQRVVGHLLDLNQRYGVPVAGGSMIGLRLTQDDLASMTGTTRETVNRVLSHLRDQGLIRVQRAQISLLNLPALEHTMLRDTP